MGIIPQPEESSKVVVDKCFVFVEHEHHLREKVENAAILREFAHKRMRLVCDKLRQLVLIGKHSPGDLILPTLSEPTDEGGKNAHKQ